MMPGSTCLRVAPPVIARCDLNESHCPPLPRVAAAIAAQADTAHRYPEFHPESVRAVLASHLGLEPTQVSVGPGATGVAAAVLAEAVSSRRAVGIRPRIATPAPTFDGYAIIADMLGAPLDTTPLLPDGAPDLLALGEAIGPDTAAVVLCSPHNPTGGVVTEAALLDFLAAVPPGVRVILDQAYIEFADTAPELESLIARFADLVVLRTFSKAYGLAAVRAGYAFGAASTIAGVRRHELPFAVSAAASAAVPIALSARAELAARVHAVRAERTRLTSSLRQLGCTVLPSQANFVYLPGEDGIAVGRLLRGVGITGREVSGHGCRLTVADAATSDYLVTALRSVAPA